MSWNKFFVEVENNNFTFSQFLKTPAKLSTVVKELENLSSNNPLAIYRVKDKDVVLARVQYGHESLFFSPKENAYRPYPATTSSIFVDLRPDY